MCILKCANGKKFAAVRAVAALVMPLMLVAPSVMAQINRDFLPVQIAAANEQKPALMIHSVEVNGRTLSGISSAPLNLPTHPAAVTFTFGPTAQGSNAPL